MMMIWQLEKNDTLECSKLFSLHSIFFVNGLHLGASPNRDWEKHPWHREHWLLHTMEIQGISLSEVYVSSQTDSSLKMVNYCRAVITQKPYPTDDCQLHSGWEQDIENFKQIQILNRVRVRILDWHEKSLLSQSGQSRTGKYWDSAWAEAHTNRRLPLRTKVAVLWRASTAHKPMYLKGLVPSR